MSLKDKWNVAELVKELDEIDDPPRPRTVETPITIEIEPKPPKRNRNKEMKDTLKKYVLAVNRGHKTYERYGFEDNHTFLLAIFDIIDKL